MIIYLNSWQICLEGLVANKKLHVLGSLILSSNRISGTIYFNTCANNLLLMRLLMYVMNTNLVFLQSGSRFHTLESSSWYEIPHVWHCHFLNWLPVLESYTMFFRPHLQFVMNMSRIIYFVRHHIVFQWQCTGVFRLRCIIIQGKFHRGLISYMFYSVLTASCGPPSSSAHLSSERLTSTLTLTKTHRNIMMLKEI